jgi:spermidine synthase
MITVPFKKAIKKVFYPYFFGKEVCKKTSHYSNIRVVDKRGYRFLIFDDPSFEGKYPEEVFQGCLYLKDPVNTSIPYADYFHFAFFLKPAIKSVFMVGLGCGLIPLQFLSRYPLEEFHVAEIDPEVVQVAARHFHLPRDGRLKIFVQDGRKFLEKTEAKYDLIILDAFFARSLPFSLFTRQFFHLVRKRLQGKGLFAVNVNGALEGENSQVFRSVYKTLLQAFPSLCYFAHRPKKPEEVQNIVIFASGHDDFAAGLQLLQDMQLHDGTGALKHLSCARLSVDDVPVFDDGQRVASLDLYRDTLLH